MGDDQPYDHSPLPSDDEEEADDFVPLPAITSNAAARGRRISVSAESMAPTADDYKKVDIPKTQEQRQRIAASVKNNFLFRNLDEDQYKDVVDAMAEKRAASGEDVIKQGAVGDFFYIVETGTLDVLVAKNGGAPVKVHHYVAGGSFGELALMYNAPRAATVTATSDCILWALDRMTFRRILMDSGEKKRRMYESFMEEVPLLKSLEANERHKIADSLEAVTFEDGQVVIKQGDAGDSFYFIVQGEAKVTQTDENGTEFALPGLKKGDYFGELALLSNKPRAATITAKGKLKCATLGKKAFDRLLGPALNIIKRNAGAYKALAHRKSIQGRGRCRCYDDVVSSSFPAAPQISLRTLSRALTTLWRPPTPRPECTRTLV